MPFRLLVLLAVLTLSLPASSEGPVSGNDRLSTELSQETLDSHFGDGFVVDNKFEPLKGDFDADGTEDLAVVAFGKNPLANSNDKKFKVADPYDAYFGFGDPKVTTKFSDFGDGTSHCVMIIHDWRNSEPKAKFVIVNLPFEKLALAKMPHKKKTLTALAATDLGGLSAMVFWDGRKYKWEPTEFSHDTDQLNR